MMHIPPSVLEKLIRRLFGWRDTEKEKIANPDSPEAKAAHRRATQDLREAVDMARREP